MQHFGPYHWEIAGGNDELKPAKSPGNHRGNDEMNCKSAGTHLSLTLNQLEFMPPTALSHGGPTRAALACSMQFLRTENGEKIEERWLAWICPVLERCEFSIRQIPWYQTEVSVENYPPVKRCDQGIQ
jgi:hypothetical protein